MCTDDMLVMFEPIRTLDTGRLCADANAISDMKSEGGQRYVLDNVIALLRSQSTPPDR